MTTPRFTLVTDGPSDRDILVPILEWLLRTHCPGLSIKVNYADTRGRLVARGLDQKIAFALEEYPCDCLFIHRDAEKESSDKRRGEIRGALELLRPGGPSTHICIVPIRMSEAWLLFDESSIRQASDNPNGTVRFELPRPSTIESLPDPKQRLHELLTIASEATRRKRKKFDPKIRALRVAGLIDDFSRLRELSAFQTLEGEIRQVVRAKRWDAPG